jgi:hypothetical protein
MKKGKNGDGNGIVITCSILNFIQNLDSLYFVQWLIGKYVNMMLTWRFLSGHFFVEKNGGCLVRKTFRS